MAAESSVEQTTIQKQIHADSCARTAFLSVSSVTVKTEGKASERARERERERERERGRERERDVCV